MLRTDQLILRAMEPTDLDVLYAWENDTKNWGVSNTFTPFSKHTLKQFIEASQDLYAAKQQRLMIELVEDGLTIGCIDFFDFDPLHKRAGVGILIGDVQNRGKGYAKKALQEITTYAREVLDLNQLHCNILENNSKSIRLFESVGFIKAGVKKEWMFINQKWVDEGIYQLFL